MSFRDDVILCDEFSDNTQQSTSDKRSNCNTNIPRVIISSLRSGLMYACSEHYSKSKNVADSKSFLCLAFVDYVCIRYSVYYNYTMFNTTCINNYITNYDVYLHVILGVAVMFCVERDGFLHNFASCCDRKHSYDSSSFCSCHSTCSNR